MTTAPEAVAQAPAREAAEVEESIRLEGISVCYRLPEDRIASFKEYVIRRITGGVRYRELWALDHVDLSVRRGEIFGIVGRNGSGKSTLLKVVSRVLRPTRGRVVVRGQLAPMLELGAGFHPDLTGRENVFLNAMILGRSRSHVEESFPEIVAFAELEQFIDVPIRNYSTGMLARLGFAVATMARPEILILDEVLAVGDGRFQRKCLERITGFRDRGTSILLVSHDLGTIETHCDRAGWLEDGKLAACGSTPHVLAAYRAALDRRS